MKLSLAAWVSVAVITVVLVDIFAFALSNTAILGFPAGPLLSIVVAAVGVVALVVLQAFSKVALPRIPQLPNGETVRARSSARTWSRVIELLADQLAVQDDTRTTLLQLAKFIAESDRQSQSLQLRIAIATTLIGLLGGWLPYLFAAVRGTH